jgi:hypothetical protein
MRASHACGHADAATEQRLLQPCHSRAQPRVGLPRHARGTGWDRIHYGARAAEPLPDPIGLQIRAFLPAPPLALVNGISAAGSTEIAGQPLEQPRHASLAMRTMQPRPEPAKMVMRPGHPDAGGPANGDSRRASDEITGHDNRSTDVAMGRCRSQPSRRNSTRSALTCRFRSGRPATDETARRDH